VRKRDPACTQNMGLMWAELGMVSQWRQR
jgi:hypothetical protein